MLAILGDIHGEWAALRWAHSEAVSRGCTAVIQVGDFGFYPGLLRELPQYFPDGVQVPIYAIDGNHEDYRLLAQYATVHEFFPGMTYVGRGQVLELDGRRVGFAGGASSVDKKWRKEGVDWFPNELLTPDQVDAMAGPVDLLITHTPPQHVVQRFFDPNDLVRYFALPVTWRDSSCDVVEQLHERLGCPPLYCGHMHRKVEWENIRILNEKELTFF